MREQERLRDRAGEIERSRERYAREKERVGVEKDKETRERESKRKMETLNIFYNLSPRQSTS